MSVPRKFGPFATMTAEDLIGKIFTDLYVGEDADNPPVTMRLDRLEQIATKSSTRQNQILAGVISLGVTIAAIAIRAIATGKL